MAQTAEIPTRPAELWEIWSTAQNGWVVGLDQGVEIMVCMTEEQAQYAADHQNDLYCVDCIPVRIDTLPVESSK